MNGYKFMEQMKFSEMHVFPYSKRTGTPAARMEDQVDEEIKNARVHELIDLSEKMQLAYAQKFVGQVLGSHSRTHLQRRSRKRIVQWVIPIIMCSCF